MFGQLLVLNRDVQQGLSGEAVVDQLGKPARFGCTLTPEVGGEL
jgi:hypothetical protein